MPCESKCCDDKLEDPSVVDHLGQDLSCLEGTDIMPKGTTGRFCLAVIRENGSDLLLFDAAGSSKAFRLSGKSAKLCFSTHGHDAAADLLTPCFDEDGLHGLPDEGCFCGLDTPHIHAHVHDPKTCDGCQSQIKDFSFLLKLTLHPFDGEELKLEESVKLPNDCNSVTLSDHLRNSGTPLHVSHGVSILGKRMHQIQHGDHIDFLVHNENTGELHLEHECNDCGEIDLHGKFQCVSKRQLGNVKLHFFEVAASPFDVLDFLATYFDTDSVDRVHAVRHLLAPRSPSLTSHVEHPLDHHSNAKGESGQQELNKKGCCKSGSCGVKSTEALPKPLKSACCVADKSCGTPKASCCRKSTSSAANCSSRDHSFQKKANACSVSGKCSDSPGSCCDDKSCTKNIPQHECCEQGTCQKRVAGVDSPRSLPSATTTRSSFVCKKICCASEIPMINSVLEPLHGVNKVMINAPLKSVTVDHIPNEITADDIARVLNENHFGASITRDGGKQVAFPSSSTGRSAFFVQKICCASEIPAITNICEPLPGVTKVSINVTTKMVYVDHDVTITSAQDIADALNSERFGAHIKHDAGDDLMSPFQTFVQSTISIAEPSEENIEQLQTFLLKYDRSQLKTFVVDATYTNFTVEHNPLLLPAQSIVQSIQRELGLETTIKTNGGDDVKFNLDNKDDNIVDEGTSNPTLPTIACGIFWAISMLAFIGGNWKYLKYVALASCAFGLPSIGMKAFRTLRRFQFDTNVLMFVAAAGALALQDFNEAAAVTFLFSISEWLEVRATTRARNALSAIVRLRPDKANLLLPGSKEIVVLPAAAVPVGTLVSVRPGDKVPCDGLVIDGYSTVDESSLTGEARPVKKGPNDKVSGGTINSGMVELIVRTTSTADNSAVAKLIRLVEEAQANRSVTEKMIDEFAKRYTPVVILAALCMCTIPWAFGHVIGKAWTNNGLVLLVIACPCALIISTPVTYVAGLAATAQRGILIKGGAHLEALGMVREIAFDKTGTLTQGNFSLLHLKTFGNLNRATILQHLSLVEERATHPLAVAIIKAVQNEGVSVASMMVLQNHTHLAGEGVTAELSGVKVYVGNERLFRRLGLYDAVPTEIKKASTEWSSLGGTVGFMSIGDDGVVCAYSVADAVRGEAREVIKSLKKLGIEPTMLTGDNMDSARAIGAQVGLCDDHILSQLLPEEKLKFVQNMKDGSAGGSSVFGNPFKPKRLVLMCGDGVNDAPALATADVGVAMGAGAALAMETSDVTLLDSNLDKLLYSLLMGRRVIRKIRENIIFSFIVKAIVVGFTLSGDAHLWAAIASDVGTMLLVTLNSMTLLPRKKTDYIPEANITVAGKDVEPGLTVQSAGTGVLALHGSAPSCKNVGKN